MAAGGEAVAAVGQVELDTAHSGMGRLTKVEIFLMNPIIRGAVILKTRMRRTQEPMRRSIALAGGTRAMRVDNYGMNARRRAKVQTSGRKTHAELMEMGPKNTANGGGGLPLVMRSGNSVLPKGQNRHFGSAISVKMEGDCPE